MDVSPMSSLILVGDEDPFNLRLLEEVCDAAGYRVLSAADGPQVLDMVARERPDVLLIDVALPKLDGFEVLRILKADAELCAIPVLLISAYDDVESRSRGIALGAEDCVSKPYRVFEVQQRIRNALRAVRGDQHVVPRHGPASSAPPPARAELGMSLDYEFTRAQRYGHPLTLLRLAWGPSSPPLEPHAQRALRAQVLEAVRPCLRSVDQLFDAGDHELAVLLPETDEDGADVVADRIREHIAASPFWERLGRGAPEVRLGLSSTSARTFKDSAALLAAANPNLAQRR
jgi:PleD family two-component response regulator